MVVLQSILAVAFGAGLFVAFDQLWRWNNVVALVLSVLVILGLVVGVRVVRKTEDIASTLIAVAVGALITLGPLALLAIGLGATNRHVRPAIKVGLSTASVYPLKAEAAFEYAARLGYDGVELMVWGESVSQDIDAVKKLSQRYRHAGVVRARAVPADLAAGVGRQPDPQAGTQRAGRRGTRRADRGRASAVPLAAPLRRRIQRPGRRASRHPAM